MTDVTRRVARAIRRNACKAEAEALAMTAARECVDQVEVLRWYQEQVSGCRKIGDAGDPYRQALAADGGKRAAAALSTRSPVDQVEGVRKAVAEWFEGSMPDQVGLWDDETDRLMKVIEPILSTRSQSPDVEAWQPIETAPRGPRIWVWEPDGLGQCVASAGWLNETPDVIEWQVVNDITCNPTHWQPLPDPPRKALGDAQ